MCINCGWTEVLEHIEQMQDGTNGDFDYAQDTLNGIDNWIRKNSHVTIAQKAAIVNIEKGSKRGEQ